MDPDERRDLLTGVPLDDLVGDAHQRSPYFLLVEDDLLVFHRFLPGLSGPG